MSFDRFGGSGLNMSNDMDGVGIPYETLGVRIVSHLRRAAVIGAAAAAFAPASASARPITDPPARHESHATAEQLELGATVLAGGSVALLVFGTIGMATVGERRRPAPVR
jgi:hypothetical protein